MYTTINLCIHTLWFTNDKSLILNIYIFFFVPLLVSLIIINGVAVSEGQRRRSRTRFLSHQTIKTDPGLGVLLYINIYRGPKVHKKAKKKKAPLDFRGKNTVRIQNRRFYRPDDGVFFFFIFAPQQYRNGIQFNLMERDSRSFVFFCVGFHALYTTYLSFYRLRLDQTSRQLIIIVLQADCETSN